MGLEVEGIEELAFLIEQVGEKAKDGVVEQMRKEAFAMRDLARKMAPMDHGNLEEAIKVETTGGGRNSLGQFTRKSFTVYVDMNMPSYDGRGIARYAYIMHEQLYPAGPLNLGENSILKQLGQPDAMVGGLYMTRAADQISEGLMNRLIQVAQTYLE
jgi:hypothetical protein